MASNRKLTPGDFLLSYIEVFWEDRETGRWWAWTFSPMAWDDYHVVNRPPAENEFAFKFSSREAAVDYAFGFIKRSRPQYFRAARKEWELCSGRKFA